VFSKKQYLQLAEIKLFKGRDFLMWILLQFISGSIQKNPVSPAFRFNYLM